MGSERQRDARICEESTMARIIVDEDVGPDTELWDLFRREVVEEGDEYLFIKDVHPGIPDVEIMDKLLQKGDILLTGDVVLHARATLAGFRAYTLDGKRLTAERLPSVRKLKPLPQSVYKELVPSYREPLHPYYERLGFSLTEKRVKRYRTARRRINSHFGSHAAISECSVTVGTYRRGDRTLMGQSMRLAGNSGVKGQRVSETYCEFRSSDDDSTAIVLMHAVRDVYLLRVEHVTTSLFVIPDECLHLAHQMMDRQTAYDSPFHETARLLLHGLADVTIHPCVKGRFHDEMQSKLFGLSHKRTNEIVSLDHAKIAQDIMDVN